MKEEVLAGLASIVGEEYLSTREDVLLTYSESASMAQTPVRPGAVVKPANSKEISEILKLAGKHGIPVTPRSGGTSLQGEVIPKPDGLVIDLLRLNKIKIYEGLRTITVGAGITFGELDKFLNQYDLWVPVSPESALSCTVAGNVAVNGAGPGSSAFGSIAEMVIGVEVVLPNGEIIQTGSEASPYVPGPFLRYAFGPDLTGLFIGSLGAFGIITKVSLKTYLRMHYFDYNTYGFDNHESAEKFLVELKENDVNGVFTSIYDGPVLELFMDMLGDEYGIEPCDWPERTISMTIGRVREDMLQSDVKMAHEICERLGGQVIGITGLPKGEWEGRLWTFVRACYAHGWHWRTLYHHLPPTLTHESVETIRRRMDEAGFVGHTAGFVTGHSSMNMYPHLFWDPTDQAEQDKVVRTHKQLATDLFKVGAVPFKLAPYWKDVLKGEPTIDNYMNFLARVKNTIDPQGILNPGVLGGI